MSGGGTDAGAGEAGVFSPAVVLVLSAVGIFAFAAFFVLSAYAPALRDGTGDGRANALSRSAVGYAALAELAGRTGTEVVLSRAEPFSDGPDTLSVLTPRTLGELAVDVPDDAHRTLVVLPKWRAGPLEDAPEWALLYGLLGRDEASLTVDGHLVAMRVHRRGDAYRYGRIYEAKAAPEGDGDGAPEDRDGDAGEDAGGADEAARQPYLVTRRTEAEDVALNPGGFDFGPALASGPLPAPPAIEDVESLQTVSGEHLTPLWTDGYGRAVLARVTVHPYDAEAGGYDYEAYVPSQTYVLADPDLVNTMGLASLGNARAAAGLLSELSGGRPVRLDLTAHGYARPRNLLTLMLEPPFLAASLGGLFAALLIGLHGSVRFGPPARERAGFALGKAALADNTATLLTASGKVGALGPRYARLARGRLARALGTARGDEAGLDARARRALGTDALAEATRAANEARDAGGVLSAARRLHAIRQGMDA